MMKITLAKKKFKKCLRINTVLPYVGRCGGIIPPTEIWRQTYFTVLHLLLCLFVFVLNK